MSRYTPHELQEMAQAALQSRDSGDPRWFDLVVRVAVHQDMAPHHVMEHIEALAQPINQTEKAAAA